MKQQVGQFLPDKNSGQADQNQNRLSPMVTLLRPNKTTRPKRKRDTIMSGDFFRQTDTAWFANGNKRRVPVEAHEGQYRQFRRRYERQAAESMAQGPKGIAEITPDLVKLISDPRNIRIATDSVIENGGVAGPDNLDLGNGAYTQTLHSPWHVPGRCASRKHQAGATR